ncbi:porin [Simiduia curdlanivorans]|uniref:Porin n=1 Tax=Simiduia curdlanivorans TaxID=1492769 RepID=A0ABV8V8V9_9GAMM|nr:porin [Simiduia curdlanivorans]MDN3639317.1 porin [Simiduia curdlanivorans]
MKKALLATAVASMATALAVNVNAADIRWNGFASITGGISTSEADRADGEELRLYGYDDDFDFRPESKLALQASSNLGNGLSVTAQAIARGADDFNVDMEWAFVSYDFGESSRINVGKLRIPFYQYSDFLDVGYAYPWIRPPESVYDLFFSTMEGANLQFNGAMGSWDSGLQLVMGRTANDLVISGEESNADLRNLVGGAWTINNDWLTLRAAYFQADTTIENTSLNAVEAGLIGAGFADQGNSLAARDDKGSFLGLGFKADNGSWLLAGEVTQIKVEDSFVADQDSAYITIGKTFNDLMFHVTYEMQEDTRTDGITDGIPFPSGNAGLDFLVGSAEAIANSAEEKSNTITVGMRYNFHPSASFKIDYSQRSFDSASTYDVDGDASVVRFSIDSVF